MIYIEVSGGIVQNVYSSNRTDAVIVIDNDTDDPAEQTVIEAYMRDVVCGVLEHKLFLIY